MYEYETVQVFGYHLLREKVVFMTGRKYEIVSHTTVRDFSNRILHTLIFRKMKFQP